MNTLDVIEKTIFLLDIKIHEGCREKNYYNDLQNGNGEDIGHLFDEVIRELKEVLKEKITETSDLKDLCAAYEAALNYDYCPSVSDATNLFSNLKTNLLLKNFIRGAKNNAGKRPEEIINLIRNKIEKM